MHPLSLSDLELLEEEKCDFCQSKGNIRHVLCDVCGEETEGLTCHKKKCNVLQMSAHRKICEKKQLVRFQTPDRKL